MSAVTRPLLSGSHAPESGADPARLPSPVATHALVGVGATAASNVMEHAVDGPPTEELPPEVRAEMAADLIAYNAAVTAGTVEPRPEPWDPDWLMARGGGHPSGAWDLSEMSPAEVVTALDDVDLSRVDDAALVELAAAWQRVVAYATAQSAHAAGELAERSAMNPEWPEHAGTVAQPCVAADELALRLSWSRAMARRLVNEGLAYRQAFTWTGEALAAGEICPVKARVVVEALADQSLEVALAVQDQVLVDAPTLTPQQLGRRVAKAVLQLDPGGARTRHEAARTRRRLNGPRMLPDGMAGLWAVLDAADAVRMDNGIDALARNMKAAGDPRTLDQLRADLLVDLTLGRLCPGDAEPTDAAAEHGAARNDSAENDPAKSDPAKNNSAENDPAESDSAENSTANDAPAIGVDRATDRSCSGDAAAGARPTSTGARSTDKDPATTRSTSNGASASAPSSCPQEPDLGSLPQRAVIHVTVPLSTLLGTSDAPADLAGYGPIAADTARALAMGGDWTRIVTDPLSGTVLDVGRTRYRPHRALADHVTARDRTCVNPCCSTRASRCDLDHTIPYDEGGPTADHNLDPLCRRDHQLKTHAGFHLEQPAPGVFQIRTPTGQVFDVTPGSEDAPRRHAPRPPWGDPPPF